VWTDGPIFRHLCNFSTKIAGLIFVSLWIFWKMSTLGNWYYLIKYTLRMYFHRNVIYIFIFRKASEWKMFAIRNILRPSGMAIWCIPPLWYIVQKIWQPRRVWVSQPDLPFDFRMRMATSPKKTWW
jgi:hypothetical protein